jgi:hypothetical protein
MVIYVDSVYIDKCKTSTSIAPPPLTAFRILEPVFPTPYGVVLIVSNGLEWKVVVRFVDIGGIGDLHFLIVTFQVTKQLYYNMYEAYNILIYINTVYIYHHSWVLF